MRNARLSDSPTARVPLAIQPTAGNSDLGTSVAEGPKSLLNKLNALNTPLNRNPFLPQLGLLEPSGRRHAAAVDVARRQLAAIHCHDGYLIAAKSADGTKADIDNVRAEVRN